MESPARGIRRGKETVEAMTIKNIRFAVAALFYAVPMLAQNPSTPSARGETRGAQAEPTFSGNYRDDAAVLREAQDQALEQARALRERRTDPGTQATANAVVEQMDRAAKLLNEAETSPEKLQAALTAEQAAYQALLKLSEHEYQISRSRNRGQRSGGAGQPNQRQLDQLELTQQENRYETQRQATRQQNPEQREQLTVLNHLKELAQRQQDLNQRLQELQTALQEAKTEIERQEVRDELKRLRDEQRELLADVDELGQRMDRPENQSRMSDARRQLDQTRSQVQRAADALDKEAVPQALTAGTRAGRELEQLRDDFRKKNSSQFAEEMRQMRDGARQLAQREEEIRKQIEERASSQNKTLSDAGKTQALVNQIIQQKSSLTNLLAQMRDVSDKAETSEPLLSRELYDTLRKAAQEDTGKALDFTSELLARSFPEQAGPFEQRARQQIDDLKRGVEKAAESVLGDETESLRLAKRELDDLAQQVSREIARANGQINRSTNAIAAAAGQAGAAQSNLLALAGDGGKQGTTAPGQPGKPSAQAQPAAQGAGSGRQPGQQAGAENVNQRSDQQGQTGQNGNQSGQARSSQRSFWDQGGNNSGWAGGWFDGDYGPFTGTNYVDWSERLSNAEEMMDDPALRAELARIRDYARVIRAESRRTGAEPKWPLVQMQVVEPLVEVRNRVAEELARRESTDSLVPIDRDPVPSRFSELVRRYYEKLGSGE
jgi:hypothetical protein